MGDIQNCDIVITSFISCWNIFHKSQPVLGLTTASSCMELYCVWCVGSHQRYVAQQFYVSFWEEESGLLVLVGTKCTVQPLK
jgi:hypothetical protein